MTRLAHLAHFIARHRWPVIGVWIVLTSSAPSLSGRRSLWNQSSAVPGQPAYEAGQRALAESGAGVRAPNVLVFHGAGDVKPRRSSGARRAAATMPGARASALLDRTRVRGKDRHTLRARLPARAGELGPHQPGRARCAPPRSGAARPVTVERHRPRRARRGEQAGRAAAPSVLVEALIGGIGALVVLLFVFGTLPAVLMPLAVALAAIMNTFTLVWALTQVTSVSVIVQFLIALVGLGIAIDYALLMIIRFREELASPATPRRRWSRR